MSHRKFPKPLAYLMIMAILMSLFTFAPMASAASINRVDKVVSVADDFNALAATLTIKEDEDFTTDFVAGEAFVLSLPSPVDWDPTLVTVTHTNAGADGTFGTVDDAVYNLIATGDAVISSDQILDITIPATVDGNQDMFTIGLGIDVDGAEGDVYVEVEPLDSGVTGGKYVFARVSTGNTTAKAMSVETIGDPGVGGDIRIEETAVNALGNGAQQIKLQLPNDFNWNCSDAAGAPPGDADALVAFSGGLAGMVLAEGATLATIANGQFNVNVSGDTLTIIFDPPNARTQRGIITVDTPIDPDNDADYGEVEVSISGTEADDADVVVAEYSDFGVDISVDSVEDIIAGKYGEELDTITIEEKVPGTLIAGRDIHFEFPSWVKITDAAVSVSGGGSFAVAPLAIGAGAADIDGTSNEVDLRVTTASSGSTGSIDIDFEISVEGNKSGDIELVVSSRNAGVEETKLVVGKAIAPVGVSCDSVKDVKIGVQSQEIGDIVIAENDGELISSAPNGSINSEIRLDLPEGCKFAVKPTVEVIEGNIDIDEDGVDLVDNIGNDDRLVIPVDDSSSKASKIKVSGIKVTVDRTVAEGDLFIKVGGGAIIENQRANAQGWVNGAAVAGAAADIDEGEFDTGSFKVKVANVVTPAPGAGKTASFKIGDEGVVAMNGRTLVQVNKLCDVLGLQKSWDAASKTAYFVKGGTVVAFPIGKNQIVINGNAIPVDQGGVGLNGATFATLRGIQMAFGGDLTWDQATQTATFKF